MRRIETVMGLPVSMDVRDERTPALDAALDRAFAVLHDAEARFSAWHGGSELSRLRRGEVREPSPDMREVLQIARSARARSGGVFDVRSPEGVLDTDGVVKGWAAQRAADVLVAAGVRDFCLNAGGDTVVHGEPEPGRPWRVGVRDPWDPTTTVAVLSVRDGAVATSGTYERGAHVWDGRTGSRHLELVAATVVARDLCTADVLATTVLAMGEAGPAWAVAHGAVAAFALTPDARAVDAGTFAAGAFAVRASDVGAGPARHGPRPRELSRASS
ncbi:FAD:protein FMN transferase [Cellulomonas sp. HZM]|uniref:FAD:protein FMN transferase n=1 Tax=Cellulomonas sp. HZM TaxID=1454010 RepID=UPI0009E0573C|nr:FAD:protein FMN transferase [Cellulomonas sp. HZM]